MAMREVGGMSGAAAQNGDGLDNLDFDDEKDDSKRKSRNLSEKKRRDQFNTLVTELGTMVSHNNRKMDKTTVLKTAISFLKQHNDQAVRSSTEEIREDWKPTFLNNKEFYHLMLEALDGFIVVLGTDGHILYISEGLSSLLGYMPASLHNTTLYEIVDDWDKIPLYNHLNNAGSIDNSEQQLRIQVHIRRSVLVKVEPAADKTADNATVRTGLVNGEKETVGEGDGKEEEAENVQEPLLELVELSGYFRKWVNIEPSSGGTPGTSKIQDGNMSDDELSLKSGFSQASMANSCYRTFQADKTVFVATGRLLTPQLIRELPVVHHRDTEFTSRHSLEWKFLFLDHRAPPIIGYLPFELLGTSGYDYYHVDDLDRVVACHESLRQTGENTSCYYRFLTKGQQWIWLQSRYYITYHQWNSKPEFIVATHKVVNYREVEENNKKLKNETELDRQQDSSTENRSGKSLSFRSGSPTWSSRSSQCESTGTGFASSSRMCQSQGDRDSQSGTRSRYSRRSDNQSLISEPGHITAGQFQLQHDNIVMSDTMSGMNDSLSEMAPEPPPILMPSSSPVPIAPSPIILTRAQQLLQRQLRTKHSELSRRIAAQQLELARLGDQLLFTSQTQPQPVMPSVAAPAIPSLVESPSLRFFNNEPTPLQHQQLQVPLSNKVQTSPQHQPRRLSGLGVHHQQVGASFMQQPQQQQPNPQQLHSPLLTSNAQQQPNAQQQQLQVPGMHQQQFSSPQQQQDQFSGQEMMMPQQHLLSNSLPHLQLNPSQQAPLQLATSQQTLQLTDSQQLQLSNSLQLQLSNSSHMEL